MRKFGLESLYTHFFPHNTYPSNTGSYCLCINISHTLVFHPAHRALPDVEAMEEIFTNSSTVDLLSSLQKRTAKHQLQPWTTQKDQRKRTCSIIYSLGRQITPQAKHLDEPKLSYTVLCEIRGASRDDEDFQRALLQHGVWSKKLRGKLMSAIVKRQ